MKTVATAVIATLAALASSIRSQEPATRFDLRDVPLSSRVWADWDGDGLFDLYVRSATGADRLFGNEGDGSFTELTDSLGLVPMAGARSVCFADCDADGFVDLLRVSAAGELVLEHNVDGVGFRRAELAAGSRPEERGLLAAEWIDYDRDGALDLALMTVAGPELWHSLDGVAYERIELAEVAGMGALPSIDGAEPAAPAPDGRSEADGLRGPATRHTPPGSKGPAPPPTTSSPLTVCLDAIHDQPTGICLSASSVPQYGSLYPLGPELNIDALGRVGVGTTTPAMQLDVAGSIRADGLRMPTGAQAGYLLTSDAAGNASWQPFSVPMGVGGSGSVGHHARFTAATTVGDSALFETGGGRLGLGTTAPAGGVHIRSGPVDVATNATNCLQLEGLAPDGTGGTLTFGSNAGPLARILQNGDHALQILSPSGIVMGGAGSGGDGNVGIKVADPSHSLTVAASAASQALRLVGLGTLGSEARLNFGDANYVLIEEDVDDHLRISSRLGVTVEKNGTAPARAMTVLSDGGGGSTNAAFFATNTSTADGIALIGQSWGSGPTAQINNRGSGPHIACSAGAGNNVFEVRHSGRVYTSALEIYGGGDLVEAFEVSGDEPEPGTVMVIDPEVPGRLAPSSGAYDRKVAGAVSGAGGVEHGIQLGQRGVLEGDTLIAMTGRIYVRCTAENGAIVPGDRLTTAHLAGHAMKATDAERAGGAVLGKAMTALDGGTGLVLVLVDLQ